MQTSQKWQQRKFQITKFLISFAIVLITFFGVAQTFAAEAGSPVQMLQSIADRLIAQLQKNKVTLKSNPQVVFSLAHTVVLPNVDVAEMSRRVLPVHTWQEANPEQRSRFEHEFVEMLVHTYATALTSYTDQKVEFFPVRGGYEGRAHVEVNSQITSNTGAPPVNVRYQLINDGGTWKIYDMSVEGVSVIESFRSQFADVLAQGNIDVLIQRLSQHNTEKAGG